MKTRLLFASVIFLIVGIYAYPTLRTSAMTRTRILPPIFAPDTTLYLNLSATRMDSTGQVIDPFYGVKVPAARMGYLKFGAAFRLFREWNSLLGGRLWWSLLLWNLVWWTLLCAIAIWFFRQFLPDNSPLMVLAGLAFIMLFNFGVLKTQVAAWMHLPGLNGFQNVQLPDVRPFFPQIPFPLVVLYLGLQIRAFQSRRRLIWVAMAVTQFFAFTIFPYAMLVMAGITATVMLRQLIARDKRVPWSFLAGYGVVCGFADLAFFLHGHAMARTGGPVQQSLIDFHPSVLPHRTGGMWLALAALSVALLFLRDFSWEVKWPIFGLGLSVLLLLLGDAFFSETELQLSTHGGYFVQMAAGVLFVFVLSAIFHRISPVQAARFALCGIVGLLIVNGLLMTSADYRYSLPYNLQQSELSRILEDTAPKPNDLVIAHSLTVDDDCAWVPLVSRSTVLFCRNAQVLLSPEQNQRIHRFRQALYLYFTNKDHQWVERVLQDSSAKSELYRLTFLGQVTTDAEERQRNIDAVRSELIPPMLEIENREPVVSSFFGRYARILVIDDNRHPYFAVSRLSQYLKIDKQQRAGDLTVMDCSPL